MSFEDLWFEILIIFAVGMLVGILLFIFIEIPAVNTDNANFICEHFGLELNYYEGDGNFRFEEIHCRELAQKSIKSIIGDSV